MVVSRSTQHFHKFKNTIIMIDIKASYLICHFFDRHEIFNDRTFKTELLYIYMND